MSLIIIAEKEIDRRVLKEAFENTPINTESYDCITKVKELALDCFILAVISSGNLHKIRRQANQNAVFAISNETVEDAIEFEEVFLAPVRLGVVVGMITQLMKEQALHKLLSPIKLGTVTLNPKTSYMSYQDKAVRLTEKELAVLIFLSKNQNIPISRQQLLNEVWGYAENVETHTLETHIYRLRQKLQAQLGLKDFLVTGEDGYVLKF